MASNSFDRAQRAYDAMTPPDEYCNVCGREASVDCICDGTECTECEKNPCECEHTYCPDCKGVDSCSCDEEYTAWKERDL